MEVIADLHIHSRFSIATAREADLEHLDLWGRYKGVQVVGTGDCTHPQWLLELTDKLEPVADGVYGLKPTLALPLGLKGPPWEATPPVRFLITGEVSTIYKKGGRVRKVHLILLLPSLEAAAKLSQRLGRLGNVTSDGRPILGLDARNLVELVLESHPEALVIPAHIWTPWFSVLGSKSGFDSLEDCFEDSLAHIYALETGLSSDPAMNWQVSALDRFLLVSNSDAHSPHKLGREANLFEVPPTYPALTEAIRRKTGFRGTLEFFPQEGKYHLDGHRQCGLRLTPQEAKTLGGRCPRCEKPLTLGVMHRVQDLADRPIGSPPPEARPFESLIALLEVLAEVLEVNAGSKKVRHRYFRLLETLGPELDILRRVPLTDLAREGGGLLAYGIDKMRRGEVHINPGYDGAYGEIHLFTQEERRRIMGQGAFFSLAANNFATDSVNKSRKTDREPPVCSSTTDPGADPAAEIREPETDHFLTDDPLLGGLNQDQRQAVTHLGTPLMVQAGPGTGKTRALTHRLAYLLDRRGVPPEAILALTFTRQAAAEMEARIRELLPNFPGVERLTVKTFHALGHQILLGQDGPQREVADEERRRALIRQAARQHKLPVAGLERKIIQWKQTLKYPEDLEQGEEPQYLAAFRAYENALSLEGLWDYEDLIARPVLILSRQPEVRQAYRTRFRHLLVDEYQDLNEAQYRLFLNLAGPQTEIMVIGDPDQAIYGFRGATPAYFSRFLEDWPQAVSCRFNETYRLPRPVLEAAQHLRAAAGSGPPPLMTHRPGDRPVVLMEVASEGVEAQAIARQIEKLVGRLSHLALEDTHLRYQDPMAKAGFKDVAVLYRLHALGPELERRLTEAGIPCQQAREGVGPEWDGLDLVAERVKLLTLHAAKGLEFPYVFIAGCEKGLIPYEPPGDGSADAEEESRLFYVGLTRASRQVFLTRARVRTLGGQRRRTRLSPLVQAIPQELLHRPEISSAAAARQGRQPHLFPEIRTHAKRAR
ncbi:MAG: UvrD-helicase domain-containing protein [Desulfobaccales bacterium]|nr:UvrD-helicase domain-containing protein [Desulfobaccales bacterium]